MSFVPGMMFGETATLDGRGLAADATSTVQVLPRAALAAEDLALAQRLVLNIAVHLSGRL